jgi:SAM-dependent methyltransferase
MVKTVKTPQPIVRFLDEHGIPPDRIDFGNMDSRQLAYEMQIFGRLTGGNAFTAEKQYNVLAESACKWKELARGRTGYRLLDVGSGEGYLLHFLEGSVIRAEGINQSVVETELSRHGRPDPETKVMKWHEDVERMVTFGSAMDMPYEDGTFDFVNSGGMLMMVPRGERILRPKNFAPLKNATAVVREMSRVMKRGGELRLVTMRYSTRSPERTEDYIVFEPHGYYAVYDGRRKVVESGDTGIVDLLEQAGLPVKSIEPIHEKSDFWNIHAVKCV